MFRKSLSVVLGDYIFVSPHILSSTFSTIIAEVLVGLLWVSLSRDPSVVINRLDN